MERTLVVIKPDAVSRRLIGQMIERFERKGLKIAALRMLQVPGQLAERMYAEHAEKDFYQPLLTFITGGPVVAMVLEGVDAILVVRRLIGPTFSPDAPGGTIRGDFGMSRRYNLVHGSDSPEAAAREIPLYFSEDEIIDYHANSGDWIYAELDGRQI